ncbi:CoA-binding protein [Cupriavidus sp. USMAA2-4]|uniref:CoA-binding protein n=1 Tax=Cupriavidus malaysiensis TaxID=367825 RepID=A0ABN4TXU3_9BURK|nr:MULTISPECIES: acetate--CoA ligase family protein [Cupriavidus]AOY96309.1 CoA-binding protein [Cupriavidus sp. USMAA2-4]AOZ09349.1 CoA-binding protein [Cupriavidus malaysiensis]
MNPSIASPASPEQALLPLGRILAPASIAIVGASADPRSFGGFVLDNLERFGYAGAVHLVSRSSTEINGRPCVKTVDALPQGIDLAVLAIPEAGVLDAVRGLAARGTHAAVLFASGYAEAGETGRVKQEELARVARDSGILLLGPNCMGFTNFEVGVPVTFEPLAPQPAAGRAGVGVVAQSGAMAANVRDALSGRGLPLTAVVSTGNEAVLGLEDVLAHYIADAQTRVIAVYAEQVRRPQTFLRLARQAREAGKPVVMLMPGRSARAREAAQSHTGALAGDHATASAALAREAVVLVDSLDELFDAAAILLRFPVPPSGGPAFMTGSGAMKNIALDFCDALDLDLPALGEQTTARLQAMLPAYAVAENPLDYTTISVRQPGLVGELLLAMLADDNIGSIVLSIPAGPTVAQRDKAEHIVPALARAEKPAVLVVTGDAGPIEPFFVDAIRASGVPFFRSPDRALRALRRVTAYGEALQRARRANQVDPVAVALPAPRPPSGVFAEYQGKAWLAAAGVAVPAGGLAQSVEDAATIAASLGYPVVIKAQASELPHKSDVGGVIIGLGDEAALRAGWQQLQDNVARHRPGLRLDGVLVEKMGERGLELVVGARRDAGWGPVVLVGLGGIWIEALEDVRLLPADLAEEDIVTELGRLKAASLLRGIRGAAAVDVRAIARVVALIGTQMRANPAILEIDVNPLLAYPDRVLALDALVVCAAPQA